MNLKDIVDAKSIRTDVPEFRVGDTVRVDYKIQEGKTHRIQAYEGIVTDKIIVVRKGMVRRAKLNYLDNSAKDIKIKERN